MKNKKGFTLIELLAIIVILAIIAVITTPIILTIIENAKKGAAQDSAYGYKDAINKWYVSKLTTDSSFRLNGTYEITDGKINGEEIPVSGDIPKNGSLTYENNILKSGCLTMGNYSIIFQNGESDVQNGECDITIKYFGFDSNATADIMGFRNSEKVSEPNSQWLKYVKETKQGGVKSYGIEVTTNGNKVIYGTIDSLTRCNTYLANTTSLNGSDAQCVEVNYRITNEFIGIDQGTSFTLKSNDYQNTINTLNTVFGCNASASNDYAECSGEDIGTFVTKSGTVQIADDTSMCFETVAGIAGCSSPF
jgi:prepilin-type N-terminal cleavage/methylation domain-containing protein